MDTINPHHFNTTADELRRFTSEFAANCHTEYLGWACRPGFTFNDRRPQRYFDVYLALGQYVRSTTGPEPFTPKRIL